jgi:hypothetical protein
MADFQNIARAMSNESLRAYAAATNKRYAADAAIARAELARRDYAVTVGA